MSLFYQESIRLFCDPTKWSSLSTPVYSSLYRVLLFCSASSFLWMKRKQIFFRDTVVIAGYIIYSGYTQAISPAREKGLLLIKTVLSEPGQPAVFSPWVHQGSLSSWGERFRDNACWEIWSWKASKMHFAKGLRGGRGAAEERGHRQALPLPRQVSLL